MSGAQLANLVNEAALNAARFDRKSVAMADFEEAKDKVLMGKERKSMIMSDDEKRNTAYHEAGHALAAHLLPDADPLHKVTIIPRGRALGVTMQLPEGDKYSYTREYMEASLTILLAGRVAEELVLGSCTTGASNDLERVTERARKMVCEWGMSEELGPLTFGKKAEQIFLGREIAQHQDYSEDTAMQIDKEVKKVVLVAYAEAKKLLEENRDALILVAEALLEYETLDANEVKAVLKGEKIHREPEVEPPDAPEPEQEEKEQEKSLPSLVNPDERPAPA
jgi:cell division protease FtsH